MEDSPPDSSVFRAARAEGSASERGGTARAGIWSQALPRRGFQRPYERGDTRRIGLLRDLAEHLGVETVATGDIHAHHPRRTLLQDVLVAIRCRSRSRGASPSDAGTARATSAPPRRCSSASPSTAAAERSASLAEQLEFDLTEELGYRYPDFSDGEAPAIRQLAAICRRALDERYGGSRARQASPLQAPGAAHHHVGRQASPLQAPGAAHHPVGARLPSPSFRCEAAARLEDKLKLIEELGLAGFFLLHHEVLSLARECAREVRGVDSPRSFLPPGRGRGSPSARSSATSPDSRTSIPSRTRLSLGRFLNRGLACVPDIDLDFPRDIREKLIVRVTERYGHEHARRRRELRDVPLARCDSRRREGARPPVGGARRLARTSDGWNAKRVGRRSRGCLTASGSSSRSGGVRSRGLPARSPASRAMSPSTRAG